MNAEPTYYLDRADDGTWLVCADTGFRQPVCRNRAVAHASLRFHETQGAEGIWGGWRTQESVAANLHGDLRSHYSRTAYRGDAFIGDCEGNRFTMTIPVRDDLKQRFVIEVREEP